MVSTEEKNPENGKIATMTDWHSIDWKRAERQVGILQKKLSDAYEVKQFRRAKRLQHILANSFFATAIAIRTVTSNKGKNTPGVDGKKWDSPKEKFRALQSINEGKYHALPLRRVYIPKRAGKVRALGIPTFYVRAIQKLYALALEPISELHADKYSYGFRKFRAAQDAGQHLFNLLSTKNGAPFIIDADIKGCFDNIDHDWMLKHIPLPKTIMTQWFKCGFMDRNCFQETEKGTPQGGLISPMLANYVLDGIYGHIHQKLKLDKQGRYSSKSLSDEEGNSIRPFARRKEHSKIRVVRYADDIIITVGHKEEVPYILAAVQDFLALRGLQINSDKTNVVSIKEGFDFLGWNYRKYNGKLLVKPSKQSVGEIKRKLKEVFNRHVGSTQKVLLNHLNPIIRGWANYHRHNASKETFTQIDKYIWQRTQRWGKRRHPKKGIHWINQKYFRQQGKVKWTFTDGTITLKSMQAIKIRRHTLIKGEENYFRDRTYFLKRMATKALDRKLENPKIRYLYFRDGQKCAYCKSQIEDNQFDIHHLNSREDNKWENQLLLHRNCHRTLHAKKERITRLSDGIFNVHQA